MAGWRRVAAAGICLALVALFSVRFSQARQAWRAAARISGERSQRGEKRSIGGCLLKFILHLRSAIWRPSLENSKPAR